jgi:hypothetical protein
VAHGSDEHLTLLGVPWHWNLLHGVDRADMLAFGRACMDAERKRAALVCDDEARIRAEAGNAHPEDSDSRSRCFAAARAAANCAKGVRGGEVAGEPCSQQEAALQRMADDAATLGLTY